MQIWNGSSKVPHLKWAALLQLARFLFLKPGFDSRAAQCFCIENNMSYPALFLGLHVILETALWRICLPEVKTQDTWFFYVYIFNFLGIMGQISSKRHKSFGGGEGPCLFKYSSKGPCSSSKEIQNSWKYTVASDNLNIFFRTNRGLHMTRHYLKSHHKQTVLYKPQI